MKSILTAIFLFAAFSSIGQIIVTGTVRDKISGKPLPGATVIPAGSFAAAVTDNDGIFRFEKLTGRVHVFQVRYLGYKELLQEVRINSDTMLLFDLEQSPVLTDEIVISATRADTRSAMAFTELNKSEIQKQNTGRDLPYLLENVPSLVATSDAGTGIGYTGVRIRGSDASRINVTINGIPINDSESQLLYWVNMPDLSSSIENIQVQRGVGTSTNGASAFGGSINIKTSSPSDKPFLNTSISAGSFNTLKTNATIGTGMIDNKWNFEGRLSKITSDGYIDRASSDLKSFFISGGYYGKKNNFRINVFSGNEITYQSWYGVPEAALDTNRTWNYYTYDNQVDNYQQDHYQLFYTHEFSSKLTLNTAFHYTYGRGYYEEFKEGELLSDYLLNDVVIGNDTITETDLIRRKWLKNDFYGVTWSLFYNPVKGKAFVLGGAYNAYDGDHFGTVIWSKYASNGTIRHRYYDNNGFKTDFNIFVKGTVDLLQKLSVFGDLQYRQVGYEFTGIDDLQQPLPQHDQLYFFNPKAGITYTIKPGQYGYISLSIGNKEPSRDDYTESTGKSRPGPERLYDFESGYYHRTEKFMAGFNYYLMMYDNQLVLTGEINDVGNYTRTNIKKSSREGVELEFGWNPLSRLSMSGNITFSKNKIHEFREYTDDYDNGGQILQVYTNTDIAFSPSITGYLKLTGKITKNTEIALINRYTGEQYLDNTSNDNKKLDSFFVNDLRVNWKIKPRFMKEISLAAMVNNFMDLKYESNGYTFSYIYGGEKVHENYYYPQAGRNYMVQLSMMF